MASSNLKSIVIKQSTSYIETLTDVNFRLLYNAIKEVVDYWAQLSISEEDKTTYKNKYNLTKFIDIEGKISLRNVYLAELQYVCLHVNGNKNETNGSLIIEPGYNFYIQLSDSYMHSLFTETIGYDRTIQDGVTLSDVDQLLWQWNEWGQSREYNPLAGNYAETWIQYTDPSGDLTNKQNCVMNIADKFVFSNDDINNIRVYDFSPYYHMIAQYQRNAVTTNFGYNWRTGYQEKGMCTPKLLTNIPPLAASSKKRNADEMWIYCPHDYQYIFSSVHLIAGTPTCSVFNGVYTDQEFQTAVQQAWGDVNANKCMVIDKLFVKSYSMGSNRHYNKQYKDRVIVVNHLCLDLGRPGSNDWQLPHDREINDAFERYPTYPKNKFMILVINTRMVPPSFENDTDARAFYTDPSQIRYIRNASNNPVVNQEYTEVDGTMVHNMFAYVPNSDAYSGWCPVEKIYVQDEFYYAFKYMDLVYEADGVTQRGGNKLMGKSGLLHSWSEYKQSYPEYYNNTTKKFWWQTNTTMNTIISTYHKEDDPNGYYKI